MSRNKINSRIKSRGKARRSPWRGLFRIVLAPVRYWPLTILIAVAALLYWQWGNIVFWGGGLVANVLAFVANTLRMFGWGLLLIAAVMLTLIGVVRWGKASSFVRYGNRWLGVVVLALAAWGILAFFNLGGSFGMDILGIRAPGFLSILVAVLRVLGLVVLGVILIAPRASLRLLKRFISRVGNQLKRHPVPRLARTSKGVVSPVTAVPPVATSKAVPVASNLEREPEKKAVSSAAAVAASFQRELKQVAQEVWKKYGESPDRVDVDGWQLPPIDILDTSPEVQFSQADNVQRARLIEEALGSYGVEARVVQINAGPTVTQFGVEPGWDRKVKEVREKDKDGNVRIRQEEISKTRVKVERINSLANDLALALAAPSIRIEAPVPGKAVVGIEVPNTVSSMVSLRGVIETSVFQKMEAKSKLSLALGKGAGGEAVAADLTKMPHLLIAGATGSGKTVCLNAIVSCLLLYNTPNDVRFIMIDPKRVELVMFNGIPHLINPVIVDADKALDALRWLSQEMNDRYQTLAKAAVRNIETYNKNRQGDQKMPYLVLIIDELADLMMLGGDEVEHILCRLAQLSRAVGIHLVVATQRPSVDVVTGLIKANFPTRISFAVTSQVDSRTILDSGGAEKLLGKGDMLYLPTEAGKPKRLQGCYVSDAEAERLVYLWGNQRREGAAALKVTDLVPLQAASRKDEDEDPILKAARQLAREHSRISASFLQRRLRIGYPRAARIIDQLEEEKAMEEGGGEEL